MSDIKAFVVSYNSPDSGQKLLGVTTSTEAAILLITTDFMKKMDHETFEVLIDDESTTITVDDGVMTTYYPIVEHGGDPDDSDECYSVQETWQPRCIPG